MTSVLMVLTGARFWTLTDGSQQPTGFWAEEFLVPYETFIAEGWDVTVATPGGVEPVVDQLSLSARSGNVPSRVFQLRERLAELQPVLAQPEVLADVDEDDFHLVFYPGGHGPMEDLAQDKVSGALLIRRLAAKRPLAMLSRGVAAALAAVLPDGSNAFAGRKMTALSNIEETLNEFADRAPWTLEDRLREAGVVYSEAALPLRPHVVVDGALYTGQNPQSARDLAWRLLKVVN